MRGMAERLTYLLGIWGAGISWSVTQLSTNLGNEEVIGYRLETKSVNDRSDTTLLHLENLGRRCQPAKLSFAIAAQALSDVYATSAGVGAKEALLTNAGAFFRHSPKRSLVDDPQ